MVHGVQMIAERTILASNGGLALAELLDGEKEFVDARCETMFDEDPDDRPVLFQLAESQAALLDVATGELLGTMVWRARPYGDIAGCTAWNIGIKLLPDLRRKGLSTGAGRLLIRHLFDSTDLDRVEAYSEVVNLPGRRGLERIGFRLEGVLRGVHLRGGKHRDLVLYSLLRSDFDDGAAERAVLARRNGLVIARARPGDRAEVADASGVLIFQEDPRLSPPVPIHRVAVLEEGTGRLIGTASWRAVDYSGSLAWRIGILLVPDERGRGFGSTAQRLLAEHLFATTELDRVEAGTDVDNQAERRALEKAGFRCDGLVRGALGRGGRRRDLALYSMLRTDI
jgi:RimJ/RimL family protein N-acetyltransferase